MVLEKKLYYALKNKGVNAKLGLNDGYKTIDIAVPDARLNIEVDGRQHNLSADQALSDLKRTYYSLKKGYFTIRVPNSLIRYHFEETVELLINMVEELIAQLEEEDEDY